MPARAWSCRASIGVADAQLKTLEVELAAEVVRCERTVDRCNAELALLKAGPRMEEIARARAEVAALDADSKRAAEDAAKYTDKAALEAGAWTVQQRDNARRLAESAAARLNAARETLGALTAGSRKEDIHRAQAIFAASQADLERAKSTQESRFATSPARRSPRPPRASRWRRLNWARPSCALPSLQSSLEAPPHGRKRRRAAAGSHRRHRRLLAPAHPCLGRRSRFRQRQARPEGPDHLRLLPRPDIRRTRDLAEQLRGTEKVLHRRSARTPGCQRRRDAG